MPKNKLHLLSALQVDRLLHLENEQMYNDGGGLYLRVRQYGAKEWVFRFTSPITKQRHKQTLGSFTDTSPKQARILASQKRALLDSGLDPLIEADKQIQQGAKELAERKRQLNHTVRNIFGSWKQAELQNRKDKGAEIERAFKKDVFPVIGDIPVNEVTKNDIKAILDRPLKRKSKRMSNRLLSDLKQFFGYAEDEELITLNPTRRLNKDRVGGKAKKSRKRYLEEQELVQLKDSLPQSELRNEYQALIWFLLSTGCRVNEVLRANWVHLHISKRTFLIPSEHAKNTLKHEVYLSRFALKQLVILKTRTTQWLVPNRKSDGPITRQVLTKQVTDRQQEPSHKNRVSNPQALVLPNGRWVIHDLRRTAGTIMQELGIMPHIIKKCLNQKIEDKIIETYQRAALVKEQKEAFGKLGQYLMTIGKRKNNRQSINKIYYHENFEIVADIGKYHWFSMP